MRRKPDAPHRANFQRTFGTLSNQIVNESTELRYDRFIRAFVAIHLTPQD